MPRKTVHLLRLLLLLLLLLLRRRRRRSCRPPLRLSFVSRDPLALRDTRYASNQIAIFGRASIFFLFFFF